MAANDPLLGEDYDQNQPPQQQRELSPTELILETERMDPATRAVVEAAAKKRAQESNLLGEVVEKKYPIDLPSPLLLASSMILAIVSTGMFFAVDLPFRFISTLRFGICHLYIPSSTTPPFCLSVDCFGRFSV